MQQLVVLGELTLERMIGENSTYCPIDFLTLQP